MTSDPHFMLKRLDPPVRPVGAPEGADRRQLVAPFEQQGFGDLLKLISRGAAGSARPVEVSPDALADDATPLTTSQEQRLAAAMDVAEAADVERALLLMDHRAFVAEVSARSIVDELREGGTSLVRIEAAVYVEPDPADAGDANTRVFRGPGGLAPPGISREPKGATEQHNGT